MSSKTTNLNLTKPSEDEFYDINVQNENMDIIDREINGLKQPAYEVSTAMSDLNSGEMITVAFGKIAKAVSTLISHTTSKATSSVLGHVKLSDSTSSTSASTAGVAATPKAVKAAYDLANSNTKKIGTTDISGIGDGTVTGAIAENKDAIEDVTQSLGLLSEGIQAVSKKQNFCKGSDRLLTDVLIIDFKNPTGESNSYGVIATEDASKLLNSPVTDGAFYAYREVLTIKSALKDYKVIVRLTEAYPSPGRIWIKMYNPDTSNWSGWNVI